MRSQSLLYLASGFRLPHGFAFIASLPFGRINGNPARASANSCSRVNRSELRQEILFGISSLVSRASVVFSFVLVCQIRFSFCFWIYTRQTRARTPTHPTHLSTIVFQSLAEPVSFVVLCVASICRVSWHRRKVLPLVHGSHCFKMTKLKLKPLFALYLLISLVERTSKLVAW